MAQQPYGPSNVTGQLLGGVYDKDRTPKVTIEAGPLGGVTDRPIGLKQYDNVIEYSYTTDVLTLGDPFGVTLSNVDGDYTGKLAIGDTVHFYVADPDVAGGAKVQKLIGLITSIDMSADMDSGCKIVIAGADLGWHLANNCGPLFHRFRGKSLNAILSDVIDPGWQISGVRQGNDFNRSAKLGRAGILPQQQAYQVVPPIQWEPGMFIADVLIPLARRQKFLLNVSADGNLQFFKPNYTQDAKYTFHHHKATESSRAKNNIKQVRFRQNIADSFSAVTCVGQVAYPPYATSTDPNEGRIRADYFNTGVLPFPRRVSFSDSDQMSKTDVANRAQWKWQRGQFDSWVYEVTLAGHSQNGNFFETDTIAEIDDSVFNVHGTYYVSACHYKRTAREGTETTLTIRQKNVLGA